MDSGLNKNDKAIFFLLAIILFIATLLRLIHPFEIPFSFDEMSAIIRTHYSSLSDEIRKGVMLSDTHPAGIQLFLYYWTKLFGYKEIVVKIPFIICGILSVYYVFRIGREWFNSTTGLVCATYVATIEYTVMYSQLARPYISGLFFALVMVWHWNNVVFKPEKQYYKNFFLYILFSACCAYNHHFSLLFAALVGVTGIFFVRKQYILKYILAGICIFFLYIPHLPIFFYQLNHSGTLDWLGKPPHNFIIRYLQYVFQFSWFNYTVAVILFLFGLSVTIFQKKKLSRYSVISFCWFVIPFLIGFFYALYISPLLEYSGLIFSFPFLLFFIFGWLPELNFKKLSALVFILCAVNVFSLVYGREYYRLFYKSYDEQQVLLNDSILNTQGSNSCISISHPSVDSVLAFYQRKYHTEIHYFSLPDSGGEHLLINYLEQNKKPFLTYDNFPGSNPIYMGIIQNYYPTILQQKFYAGGTVYLFSNKQNISGSPYSYHSDNKFDKPVEYWAEPDKKRLDDSIRFMSDPSYCFDSLQEWGASFTSDVNAISSTKSVTVFVSVDIYPFQKLDDVILVTVIKSGNNVIYWNGTEASSFLSPTTFNKWQKIYNAIDLSGLDMDIRKTQIQVYLWNKGRKKFNISNFEIKLLKDNPIVYSLLAEKI